MSDATPIPVVRLVAAVVVAAAGGTLAVNVNGTTPPVWWPAGYIPTVGDPVKVLMVDGTAVVHSPVITGQRPLTGTVSGAPAGGLVPVATSSGTVQCRYTGTAPAIGLLVRLDWQATTPWVWPSAATGVTPPTGVGTLPGGPSGPPVTSSGKHTVTAMDSGSWSAQGWSSFHGTDLTQGAYGGGSAYTGAWFYGSAPQQIAGATVSAIGLRLGARRRLGSYNSSAVLHVYLTNNATRPAGDTTRVAGPVDITLVPNAGAQWVSLPVSWGQTLADAGGGIAVAGNPYAGVNGIGPDPESGQLSIDWAR